MFKRIVSAAVALIVAACLLPRISLPLQADAADTHTPWKGYEEEKGISLSSLNFDVWDSSSESTDWYSESSGTEDDPYIISSASDLAGIQKLIDDSGSASHLFENSFFRLDCNINLGAGNRLSILDWGDRTTFKGGFDLNNHYLIGDSQTLFAADLDSDAYLKNGTIASVVPMFGGGNISNLDIYSLAAFYKDTSLTCYELLNGGNYNYDNNTYSVSYAENIDLHAYEWESFGFVATQGSNLNLTVLSSGTTRPAGFPTYTLTVYFVLGGDWTDSVITYDVPIVTGPAYVYMYYGSSPRLILHNSVIDLDWDCSSDSPSAYANSYTYFYCTAYDSQFNLDFKCDSFGSITTDKYLYFYNCDVSMRLPAKHSRSNNLAGPYNFYDSTVRVADMGQTFIGELFGDAVNSSLEFELTDSGMPSLFRTGTIENSYISVKQLPGSGFTLSNASYNMEPMFYSMVIKSSVIDIDMIGADETGGSVFQHCYVKDCDVQINSEVSVSVNGWGSSYAGHGLFENTNIVCHFDTPHEALAPGSYSKSYSEYRDCTVCIVWDSAADGVVAYSPLEINSAKNTAIVIKGPKTVEYPYSILSCAMYDGIFVGWGTREGPSDMNYSACFEGTLIVDGVTLSGESCAVVKSEYYSFGYYRSNLIDSISGAHIFANIYTNGVENLVAFDRVDEDFDAHMSGAILNAYDYTTGKPYDGSLSMILLDEWVGVPLISDVYFKSNTASADAALVVGLQTASLSYNTMRFMYDIYMNLPNAVQLTNSSSTASGYRSGLFAYWDDDYTPDSPDPDNDPWYWDDHIYTSGIDHTLSSYAAIDTQLAPLRYSNVYVPAGQSFIYEYYNSDTSTMDTWQAYEKPEDSALWADGLTLESDFVPDGAIYVSDWEKAELDGSLAYKLDHGSNYYRRTDYWTVVEEIDIADPLTGEYITTVPAHLGHTSEWYPESIVTEVPNLNAVYKLTMNKAEAGSVEVVGVDNVPVSSGDVYVRYGDYPISGVTAGGSKTLAYATQSINGGIPIRISSQQLTAGYSEDGFSMPSADIEITPVFNTARYITVELTGESAHGSLIPSEYESAEGEEIYLSIESDTDYIVSDIRVNGEPCTDFRFIMPDEDVVITAEVIPFEGGITDFRLGGFAGVIDQNQHTIVFDIPRISGIENMKPYIEYTGTSISPSEEQSLDFTKPQTFTVTYGPDNSTVTYTVEVNMSDYDMRIHDFVINGIHGEINQASRTITLVLPNGTDITSIVPDSIAYSAEAISPSTDTAVDFTVGRTYTLTASGMSAVTYLVSVVAASDDMAILDELRIGGYDAVIDQTDKTATITVPRLADLDGIVPSILKYTGKTISPSKLESLDLNNHVETYTILSQNGTPVEYTVNVVRIGDSEAEITKFVLAGYEGVIDQEDRTITVSVAYGTILADITPDVIEYRAAGIYPTKDVSRNFGEEQTYIAYAPDGLENVYTVKVVYNSPDKPDGKPDNPDDPNNPDKPNLPPEALPKDPDDSDNPPTGGLRSAIGIIFVIAAICLVIIIKKKK